MMVYWSCISEFQDLFDLDHFITSLRDEVRILKELPPRLKQKVENGFLYSMPPISWSDMSYYKNQVSFLIFRPISFLNLKCFILKYLEYACCFLSYNALNYVFFKFLGLPN
jgi:hypothetical protein